ncbi:Uma2 family endonuclease [Microcoleus sp. bin38.metabat.b11b12b14.051]|uniref:Uma2 family endonuclease n=1 Tax=Microcoleus sp. bin38.metabat.b11b12b14.051 TaxID=2742709 RepID=UPI0025E34F8E|nr:Uma2 family endonuclease [Microcoleus sp. bin38.metabat.b11b12b14.051]
MTQTKSSAALAVNIPPTLTLIVTREQFVELAIANRDVQLEWTATGELILNPPTGGEIGKINSDISGQIWLWNRQTQLGVAFSSSTGFTLPNRAIRSPDVSWVCQPRWDALTSEQRAGFAPLAPDFVVELCSETDRMKPLRDKMKEYMENQVRLGWLIDRKNRKVEIYRLNQEVEVLDNPATLSGEDVLPGFILDLREVWA